MQPVKKKPRIGKESPKSAQAYQVYESLGPDRSFAKVVKYYQEYNIRDPSGKPYCPNDGTLKEWSTSFGWVARAKAHDEKIQAKEQKEIEEQLERMNKEHALIGRTEALNTIQHVKKMRDEGRLGATAAVEYIKFMITLERLARGAVSERTEQIQQNAGVPAHMMAVDPRTLSNDELQQLKAMITRALAEQQSTQVQVTEVAQLT